jgi:hypothetical protein
MNLDEPIQDLREISGNDLHSPRNNLSKYPVSSKPINFYDGSLASPSPKLERFSSLNSPKHSVSQNTPGFRGVNNKLIPESSTIPATPMYSSGKNVNLKPNKNPLYTEYGSPSGLGRINNKSQMESNLNSSMRNYQSLTPLVSN